MRCLDAVIGAAMGAVALAWSVGPRSLRAADRPVGPSFATRSEVVARHGAAATSQPLATQIAIVWDNKQGKLFGLNASGRSPKGLTAQQFAERGLTQIPLHGALPVSVPGCVDGWFALHRRFGRLPIDKILQPTIDYAREGFPVSPVIAQDWRLAGRGVMDQPGFRETFLIDGHVPVAGEVFRNEPLAHSLEQIAAEGRKAFYEGPIARAIDRDMRQIGGYLRFQDLAEHHSQLVDPVSTDYRGVTVWELPPNGQGIAALQILNILEGFDLSAHGFGSPEHLHWFIEAKKLAFEDRARYYADPQMADVPVERLISKEYAAQRRKLIDPDRAAKSYPEHDAKLDQGDTIYLTVADRDRNMVSLIQSNYHGFGSGVCPPGLGFCLQNRGQLFDLTPGRPNSYAPGKRPFHTIIPAFLTRDGKPLASFGVMGGAMQPQGHAQIVINLVDFKMGLQAAGDAPRIRHSGSSQPTGERMKDGGTVLLESGFRPDVIRDLMLKGHRVQWDLGGYGGYQAIWYDAEHDVYFAASESRKDGQAGGY